MELSPEEYQQLVHRLAKKSPIVKDTVMAFLVGGLICVIGQLIQNGWLAAGLNEEELRGMDPDDRVAVLESARLDPYNYIYLAC